MACETDDMLKSGMRRAGVAVREKKSSPHSRLKLGTVAAFGPYLYAVNARFGTPPTPDTTYTVVRLRAAR